jgi:hypothetical protein
MRRAKLKDYLYHLICHPPTLIPPAAAITAAQARAT